MKYFLILITCAALSIGIYFATPFLPSGIMNNRIVAIIGVAAIMVAVQVFLIKNIGVTALICAIFGFGFLMGTMDYDVRTANIIVAENVRNVLFGLALAFGLMWIVDWWRARDIEV